MNFIPLDIIPDVSFYQDDNQTPRKIDFVKMRAQTQGVIIRAGQNTWIDEDVIENWKSAKEAGLKRGSYWFYDSRSSPQSQAQLWKQAIGNDAPEWGLWCDLEESYNGAYKGEANWKAFVEAVRVIFPNVKIGIYTANWWWKLQVVNQADYWASFPLWVAQYTTDPLFVTVPAPWKNKGAILWQYTDKGDGLKYGAESLNIDLNKTSQAFYNFFGTPPASDIITLPYPGVLRTTGTRNGWKFVYQEIDPALVKLQSVYLSPLDTVSNVGRYGGATIAMNAGEWDRVRDTVNYTVCDGVLEVYRTTPQPSLMVTYDNKIILDHKVQTEDIKQAFTGLRYLVGALAEPSLWNNEGHSRTIYGVNAAGHLLTLCTEGVYPNQGWTLLQCREYMLSQNAILAADFGGGGDTTLWDKSQGLLLTPENPNGYERYLPNVFMITVKESTAMQYKVIWSSGVSKRLQPTTNAASTGVVLPLGAVVDVVQDKIPDATYPTDVNKLWVKFTDGTFGASIYGAGSVRMELVAAPPPVAEFLESETIEPASGTIITKLYNTGRVEKIVIP